MIYNRQISNWAPLPSGPLPTQQDLDVLARRASHRRGGALITSLRRVFKAEV